MPFHNPEPAETQACLHKLAAILVQVHWIRSAYNYTHAHTWINMNKQTENLHLLYDLVFHITRQEQRLLSSAVWLSISLSDSWGDDLAICVSCFCIHTANESARIRNTVAHNILCPSSTPQTWGVTHSPGLIYSNYVGSEVTQWNPLHDLITLWLGQSDVAHWYCRDLRDPNSPRTSDYWADKNKGRWSAHRTIWANKE